MPSLRERIGLSAALLLALGTVVDGLQPPARQLGVHVHAAGIQGYRALLKPLIEGTTRCKFEVTCSEYSLNVVRAHGWPKGGVLTIKRLMECR